MVLYMISPLMWSQQDVRLAVQTGHSGTISDLCFNPTGDLIASASVDNNVAIWHIESGKQFANLNGHTNKVTKVAFHPAKNELYSVGLDSNLIIWDIGKARIIQKIKFNFPIGTMAIDTFNKRLLIAGNDIVLFDLKTQKQTKYFLPSTDMYTAAAFSKSGRWFAIGGKKDRFTKVIDTEKNEVIGQMFGNTNDIVFDDEEQSIFCATENGGITNYSYYYNTTTGTTNKSEWNSFNGLAITFRYLIGTTDKGEVVVYSRLSGERKHILKTHLRAVKCIDIDPSNRYMISAGAGKRIILWDLKTMEMIKTFKSSIFRISQIDFSPEEDEILIAFTNGALRKDNLFTNTAVSNRPKLSQYQIQNGWEFFLRNIENNKTDEAVFNLLLQRNSAMQEGGYDYLSHVKILWNSKLNEILVQETNKKSSLISNYEKAFGKGTIFPITYFVDTTHLVAIKKEFQAKILGSDLQVINNKTNQEIFKVKTGHSDKVTSVAINYKHGFVATSSWDGMVKMWRLKDGKLLTTYGAFGGSDFVYISPDNYYYASKGALDNIGFIYKDHIYAFDQFDLVYNRPDIVYQHLPYITENIIENYKLAREKRLDKMGLLASDLSITTDIPSLEIINKTGVISQDGQLKITIDALDEKHLIHACHINVNGVPVYGKEGKMINAKTAKLNENIRINPGKNVVQVYVTNSMGVSSFKKSFQVVSKERQVKSNLYVLAVGCSKYQQSQYNLNFADKDANDMIKFFKRSRKFDQVFTKKIINEQVVLSSEKDMQAFFKPANENDVVLLFIAGHGVLDAHLDYFIASHDMDFNNPAEKGIPIHFFDNLIDGVRSRKKLMFIDACHSGEIDKAAYQIDTSDTELADANLVFRAVGNQVKSLTDVSAFELSKMAFADMRESNGSTVISSAGGGEYAMEGEEWSNGVFTYVLLRGLKSGDADLNKDKVIMVAELHAYLIQNVNRITKGLQTPTSRVENLDNDFRIQ